MFTSRSPRTTFQFAALVATALVAASCAGSDGDGEPSAEAVATTAAGGNGSDDITGGTEATPATTEATPATTAATEPTTTTSTTTTTTLPPRQGATPDDPAPVGDPSADLIGFERLGYKIDAHIDGLVRLDPDPDRPPDGVCYAVLGTYTLVEGPRLTGNYAQVPEPSLVVGGEMARRESRCDVSSVGAAGWHRFNGAEFTVGSTYSFHNTFAVPEGAEPQFIRVGLDGAPLVTYWEPTVLDAVPAAPTPIVGELPDLLPAGDSDESTISVEDNPDAVWEIAPYGVFAGEFSERNTGESGRCLLVLGSMKGTKSVGAIVSAFSQPEVKLFVDGRTVGRTVAACDEEQLSQSGYRSTFDIDVAIDNTVAFYTTFVLADGEEPSAIVIGAQREPDSYRWFEAPLLDAPPPPPEREQINPTVDLVEAGAPDNFTTTWLRDATWTGTVFGLVELPASGEAVCYAVVGEMAADADDTREPSFRLIYGGEVWSSPFFGPCDTSVVEDAGYELLSGEDTTVRRRFYHDFALPPGGELAAIAIGDPTSVDNVVYVDPVVLAEIPVP